MSVSACIASTILPEPCTETGEPWRRAPMSILVTTVPQRRQLEGVRVASGPLLLPAASSPIRSPRCPRPSPRAAESRRPIARPAEPRQALCPPMWMAGNMAAPAWGSTSRRRRRRTRRGGSRLPLLVRPQQAATRRSARRRAGRGFRTVPRTPSISSLQPADPPRRAAPGRRRARRPSPHVWRARRGGDWAAPRPPVARPSVAVWPARNASRSRGSGTGQSAGSSTRPDWSYG